MVTGMRNGAWKCKSSTSYVLFVSSIVDKAWLSLVRTLSVLEMTVVPCWPCENSNVIGSVGGNPTQFQPADNVLLLIMNFVRCVFVSMVRHVS